MMIKEKCFSKDVINEYLFGVIDKKLKKKVEEHLYGKVSSFCKDKDLDYEVESHSGGGCGKCFKLLAEVIESAKASAGGAEVLKHL